MLMEKFHIFSFFVLVWSTQANIKISMNIIKKSIGIKKYCIFFGAVGETRTLTGNPHAPQACLSTNFSTTAYISVSYTHLTLPTILLV